MNSPNPHSPRLSSDELRRRERARRELVDLEQLHLSHYAMGLHERRDP